MTNLYPGSTFDLFTDSNRSAVTVTDGCFHWLDKWWTNHSLADYEWGMLTSCDRKTAKKMVTSMNEVDAAAQVFVNGLTEIKTLKWTYFTKWDVIKVWTFQRIILNGQFTKITKKHLPTFSWWFVCVPENQSLSGFHAENIE